MYRIIKLKKVTFCQANVARASCVDTFSFRGCSLCCNSRSSTGFVQNYSTGMPYTIVKCAGRKKRGAKSKEKISELLAVDFFSASEEKAQVTALKVRDVTRFVKSPHLNLQEMYKLRSKHNPSEKSSASSPSNLKILESRQSSMGVTLMLPSEKDKRRSKFISFTSSPLLSDPAYVSLPFPDLKIPLTANSFMPLTHLSFNHPNLVEESCTVEDKSNTVVESFDGHEMTAPSERTAEKSEEKMQDNEDFVGPTKKSRKKKNKSDIEYQKLLQQLLKVKKERREYTLYKNLKTYLQVCANNGQFRICNSVISKYCRRRELKGKLPNVTLFESVLRGAALHRSIDSIRYILDVMSKYKVELSLNCYASCFECFGRINEPEKYHNIFSTLLENMKINNFSLHDIFSQCKFSGDQKSMILKAIRMKIPDFSVNCDPLEETYEAKLLAALNDPTQAKAKTYTSPAAGMFSHASVCSWIEEQINNDMSGVVKIPNIAFTSSAATRSKCLKNQAKMEKDWAKMIREGFLRDLQILRKTPTKKANRLLAVLKSLPPNEFVDLLLQEVRFRFGDSEMFSPPMSVLCSNLGRKVKRLHDLKILTSSGSAKIIRNVYRDYCKWYLDPQSHPIGPSTPREIWHHLERFEDNRQEVECNPWSHDLLTEIGKFLYTVILRDIKIDVPIGRSKTDTQAVPAFYTIYRKHGQSHQEQLKMHPSVNRIYQPSGQPYIFMESFDVPMCSPPVPWTNSKHGAFPLLSPSLLRLPAGPGKKSRGDILREFDEVPTQQIYPALDALNQLGSIPWKVNSTVLDIVTEVFNSGGSLELNIPLPPTTTYPQPPLSVDASREERIQHHSERMAMRKEQAEMFSLWCDALYRLSLAHHFRNKVFWLPHNMDFRGRVYPIAPHLQHMGCDMARALLIFGKGEKLGSKGLDWLKIHTINLTGQKKKEPLSERLSYANEMLDKIFDSADNPLTGDKWWAQSDEPWQTLAACIEIATAIRSGDPENFVSHFPVHQDGSCNGLQHYAALGRDAEGAASVNLSALDRPADVYSRVAEIVERRRKADAENGNELAQKLDGFVTRKVVKQTIMTTVYGVTRYGARLQIAGQLKDLGFPQDEYVAAATYLAGLTFDSIGEMFSSTQKIQDWLTNCANVIGKIARQPVRWVTPLGLPVVQPYFKQIVVRNKKPVQEDTLYDETPNVLKQRNGFPPNFIHSLDSCHMMMTSLFCEQSGISYVSVHDCFWVHPCNVDNLNKICREQFVALHSEPILENLSEFLVRTYVQPEEDIKDDVSKINYRLLKRVLSSVPMKGKFNLEEVLSSVYFFS